VRECHRQRPGGRAAVAVFADQRPGGLAAVSHASGEGDADERARRQANAIAQHGDRIEHGAGRAGQRAAVERDRIGRRAAATDELRAVGFPFTAPPRRPSTPST
jgi:hypothetical protein